MDYITKYLKLKTVSSLYLRLKVKANNEYCFKEKEDHKKFGSEDKYLEETVLDVTITPNPHVYTIKQVLVKKNMRY